MKPKEIRELSIDELKQKDKELREECFNQKLQLSTGQLANTAGMKQARKDISRVSTILREKELER